MTEPYPFHTKLRVRYNEVDMQGHANFTQYFVYFDIAIIEYLRTFGHDYTQMMENNLDMLYVDAHSSYHSPAPFDEVLRLHCRIGKVGNTSLRYDIQIFSDVDDRLIVTGEITAVMAEPGTWKKVTVPDWLREAVVED